MPPKKVKKASDPKVHGRQCSRKAGRPPGAKNKERKSKYNFEIMKTAIKMDIHMSNVKATGTAEEIEALPYGGSRRAMCDMLNIPESTL